jgi:hypothetical protein
MSLRHGRSISRCSIVMRGTALAYSPNTLLKYDYIHLYRTTQTRHTVSFYRDI